MRQSDVAHHNDDFLNPQCQGRVLEDVVATHHFALCPLAQVSAHGLVISFWMREENRQTVDMLTGFALQQRQGQKLAAAAEFPQKVSRVRPYLGGPSLRSIGL